MEEIIKNGWEKLLPFIFQLLDICSNAWQKIWPYITEFFSFCSNAINNAMSFIKNVWQLVISFAAEKYNVFEPQFENFAQNNHYWATFFIIISLLFFVFWIWMLLHALKNEIELKKTWLFIIITLGPIGSLCYFFRKRHFELLKERKDKLMVSFFSPMSKK